MAPENDKDLTKKFGGRRRFSLKVRVQADQAGINPETVVKLTRPRIGRTRNGSHGSFVVFDSEIQRAADPED